MDRGQSLGKDLPVASVRTERIVVDVKAVRFADGGGLLSDGKVCGTGIGIFDAVVNAFRFDIV